MGKRANELSNAGPLQSPAAAGAPDVRSKIRNPKAFLDSVRDSGSVSFDIVAKSHFEDDQSLPELLKDFQRDYGSIDRYYWASTSRSGVALTLKGDRYVLRRKKPFLHTVADRENPRLAERLRSIERLRMNADERLMRRERRTCLEELYVATEHLLTITDTPKDARGNGHPAQSSYESVEQHVKEIDEYFRRSARRRFLFNYLAGMILGVLIVAMLGMLLQSQLGLLEQSTSLLGAFVAGALGAVFSVMTRMNSPNFLPEELGPWNARLLGTVRPIIGAISGLVVFSVFVSGIAPSNFQPPSDEIQRVYFFLTVAFFSGFSERFATTIFSKVEHGFDDASQMPPTEGDKAKRKREA